MKTRFLAIVAIILLLPSIAWASFDRNLRYGSKGSDVTELQEFLTDQGLYSGPITGKYYALTTKGVKNFQVREKLSPTGTVNLSTRTRLNDLLVEQLRDEETETIEEQINNNLLRADDIPLNLPASLDFSNPWTNPSTLQPVKPVTDWCNNIYGDQPVVPLGYTWQPGNFCAENSKVVVTEPVVAPVAPSPIKLEPIQTRKFFFSGSDAFGVVNDIPFIQLEGLKPGVSGTMSINGSSYTMNNSGRFLLSGIKRNYNNAVSYSYVINFTYNTDGGQITGTHVGNFSY